MKQYLDILEDVMETGIDSSNRTGTDTRFKHANMTSYDLAHGFPIITTKKFPFKVCVAEMLGFIRAYDSAADFRELGVKFWDDNANKNEQWLNNPNRKGEDDLGRIYGVQSRDWQGPNGSIDQLKAVVKDLSNGIDNRREIVTHWNPGEIDQMALPPCHMFYQFGIRDGHLDMIMYQRSCDLFLGVPFNITGYSWLLSVIAHITGLKVGVFSHVMWNYHIYHNHFDQVREQLSRTPHKLPTLKIDPTIQSLNDLETWVIPDNFELVGYTHDPLIKAPMAV